MPLNKILITALVVFCVALLITLAGKKTLTGPAREMEAVPIPIPLPEGEIPQPVPERESISETAIEKLYLGYSYEEIEDLFGIPADERESEYRRDATGYTAPHTIVWYTWENPDSTLVRLGFINNKLERKQFIRKDGIVINNEVKLDDLE